MGSVRPQGFVVQSTGGFILAVQRAERGVGLFRWVKY